MARTRTRRRFASATIAGVLLLGGVACGDDADDDGVNDDLEEDVGDLSDDLSEGAEDLSEGADDLGGDLSEGIEDELDDDDGGSSDDMSDGG